VAGDDEDRDTVVVVAAPTAGRLERPSAGDDSPGRHELVHDPAVDRSRTAERLDVERHAGVVVHGAAGQEPVVQAFAAVPEAVLR
jgi:hypothetical protein